jgi:hypothetical protein
MMFDAIGNLCDRCAMRRLIALFVLLAFASATAAPAITACRMRTTQKECCCAPAPAGAICAPDCCDAARPARAVANAATQLRGFAFFVTTLFVPSLSSIAAAGAARAPMARALVGLHERAAPRLPLRI